MSGNLGAPKDSLVLNNSEQGSFQPTHDAPSKPRRQLGEILVANGTISEKTLERALRKAKQANQRIGVVLEDMGIVTGEEIAAALADQFGCKIVSKFQDLSYSPDLLKILPIDAATRYFLFPLKLELNKLCLAMADPTDTRFVSNMASNNGLTIIPFIATRGDITAAINKHYLGNQTYPDRRKTVLIVEDNAAIASELEKVLSKEGYRIVGARNGMDAFKKAIGEAPDVILTDKEMPIFDGYKLLESLKCLPETLRIPVILLTSSTNGSEESDAFKKGFFDFIAKPAKDVTLIARIKRALATFDNRG